MSRIDEFSVCPICGERLYLELLSKDDFEELWLNDGLEDSGFVSISCRECRLTLDEFVRAHEVLNKDYDFLVDCLKVRWNNLSDKARRNS